MAEETTNNKYAIMLVGDSGSGCTTITRQLFSWPLEVDYPEYEHSEKRTLAGTEYDLEIVDLPNVEFKFILQSPHEKNISKSEGFLIVYSITRRESFEGAKKWLEHLRRVKDIDNPTVILIGNQSDLEDKRQVTTEEGKALAQEWKCQFIETSAKTNVNIEKAFLDIIKEINEARVQAKRREEARANKKDEKCLIS